MADDAPAPVGVQIDGPSWGYRKVKDTVEAKLFADGFVPEGWELTPANFNDPAYTRA